MRVGVFREPGHDPGKDENMAEYGMVGRHRLVKDSEKWPGKSCDVLTKPSLLNRMALRS